MQPQNVQNINLNFNNNRFPLFFKIKFEYTMGELYNSLLPLGRKKLLYRRFFEDKTTMGESCNTTPVFISYLFLHIRI